MIHQALRQLLTPTFRWLLGLLAAVSFSAGATSVVFLNPGKSNEKFWLSVSQLTQAAADDLGLSLEVIYAERERQAMISNARMVLNRAVKPDFLLVVNEKQVAPEILEMTSGSSIKVFLLLNALAPAEIEAMSQQGIKLDHLIGSLVPNNQEAGYRMAKALIAAAKNQKIARHNGKLQMFAIGGDKTTPAAIEREIGLRRALKEHPEVALAQLVYGEWNAERAEQQAEILFKRYPETKLVWAANDQMAFGAMKAARQRGEVPGKTMLFAGLNNSNEAMQARADGSLSVLAAGHFTAGAWAMVMLHDYLAGKPFSKSGGKHRNDPLFELFNKTQAERFLAVFGSGKPPTDFRRFSLAAKPSAGRYRFSLLSLLAEP